MSFVTRTHFVSTGLCCQSWGASCDHVPHTTTPLTCHSSCTDRSCTAQCWVPPCQPRPCSAPQPPRRWASSWRLPTEAPWRRKPCFPRGCCGSLPLPDVSVHPLSFFLLRDPKAPDRPPSSRRPQGKRS